MTVIHTIEPVRLAAMIRGRALRTEGCTWNQIGVRLRRQYGLERHQVLWVVTELEREEETTTSIRVGAEVSNE